VGPQAEDQLEVLVVDDDELDESVDDELEPDDSLGDVLGVLGESVDGVVEDFRDPWSVL
jgi:hypothetical protein